MPDAIKPRGITISFESNEIDWLYWVMQNVLTDKAINNPAKNKIIVAHSAIHANHANKKTDHDVD
ncbi:MAG: hypothetical protein EBZ69_00295 [Alphaproteobacteria bacterium]|nr:hypothetical protein [Alphaproteobacteria bacterium]